MIQVGDRFMATGKVLQFDQVRGYGFVAADDDGDDVFLHASAFDGDSTRLVPGTDLQFQIMASDRGRKAYLVRLTEAGSATPEQLVPPQQTALSAATEEEQMCDVLSKTEFGAELTELLLNTVPGLTGPQILEVRQSLLEFADKRGWVDA
jgi:cold shock CspA family protein